MFTEHTHTPQTPTLLYAQIPTHTLTNPHTHAQVPAFTDIPEHNDPFEKKKGVLTSEDARVS